MGMLGHDDIRPNVEAVLRASPVNRIDQPLSTSIFAQECLPTKARECEGMGLAGSVVSLASFSIGHVGFLLSHAHAKPWAWHPTCRGHGTQRGTRHVDSLMTVLEWAAVLRSTVDLNFPRGVGCHEVGCHEVGCHAHGFAWACGDRDQKVLLLLYENHPFLGIFFEVSFFANSNLWQQRTWARFQTVESDSVGGAWRKKRLLFQ